MWLYWNVMNCTPVWTWWDLMSYIFYNGRLALVDLWTGCFVVEGPCARETQKVISDLLCQLSPSVSQVTAAQMVLLLRRVNYTSKCSRSWDLNVLAVSMNIRKEDLVCLVRLQSFFIAFSAGLIRCLMSFAFDVWSEYTNFRGTVIKIIKTRIILIVCDYFSVWLSKYKNLFYKMQHLNGCFHKHMCVCVYPEAGSFTLSSFIRVREGARLWLMALTSFSRCRRMSQSFAAFTSSFIKHADRSF